MSSENPKTLIISWINDNSLYWLCWPQYVASELTNAWVETRVLWLSENAEFETIISYIRNYFGESKIIIWFSSIENTESIIIDIAKHINHQWGVAYLWWVNSRSDYIWEENSHFFSNRFQGYSNIFDFAINGNWLQTVWVVKKILQNKNYSWLPWIIKKENNWELIENTSINPPIDLSKIDWSNLDTITIKWLIRNYQIKIWTIVWRMWCHYSRKTIISPWEIPYNWRNECWNESIPIISKWCSFCTETQASNINNWLTLSSENIRKQILNLPNDNNWNKIPFYLLDQNPRQNLDTIIKLELDEKVWINSISFNSRVDSIDSLRFISTLMDARQLKIQMQLKTIWIESFNQSTLDNLWKWTSVKKNLEAIKLCRAFDNRKLASYYITNVNNNGLSAHSLIFPTPWDTVESMQNQIKIITANGFQKDFFPGKDSYIPLVIHHWDPLWEWIRKIEERSWKQFERNWCNIKWISANDPRLTLSNNLFLN